jgi:hypothetical protein
MQASVFKRFPNGTWVLSADLESEPGVDQPGHESLAMSADNLVIAIGEGGHLYQGMPRSGKSPRQSMWRAGVLSDADSHVLGCCVANPSCATMNGQQAPCASSAERKTTGHGATVPGSRRT